MNERVGPYEVVREVQRAPGAMLAEARDGSGQTRLLMVMRFRAIAGDDEREKRSKQEKVLAQRTMELIGDSELVVHAHGGADAENGERVLFWALPWSDAPFLIDRVKTDPLSSLELIRIGVALAERMAARHAWGRVDPLLSEHLLRANGEGRPEVVGVPIAIDKDWLAPSMLPVRLAPEETSTEDRRPSGDVWRLGRLLSALAENTKDLSDEMRTVIAQMSEEDTAKRTQSAPVVLEQLERLGGPARTTVHANGRAVFESLLAPTVDSKDLPNLVESSSWEIPTLTPRGAGAEEIKEIEAITARARAQMETTPSNGTLLDSEAVTSQSEPQTPVPAQLPSILVDRTDTASEKPRMMAPSIPTDGAVRAMSVDTFSARDTLVDAPLAMKMPEPTMEPVKPAGDRYRPAHEDPRMAVVSTERLEPQTPLPSDMPLVLPFDPTNNERARELEPKKTNGHHPVVHTITTPGHMGMPSAIDPLAASWAQPVLPAGESPWSEVVHPRGTHTRDRGDFPGFPDDISIPARVTLEKRSQPFEPISIPELDAPPAYAEVPTSEIEVELAAALKGVDKKKVISGVLIALVMFGLFALLSRTGTKTDARAALVITEANEVSLASDPPGATVVAEADGMILGKTPMRFLIAPDSDVVVYLVAPSREPLRLSLPSRGGLTAQLRAIDANECVVTVTAPGGVELEGVDVEIGSNAERHVPGAVVVRAKAEQDARGARLVLCPSLGGDKEQELRLDRSARAVAVRVTQPEGAAAYLNGDPIGPVPGVGRTNAAFSRVRIDDQNGISEERWVSTLADSEVRMPPPAHAKPVVHLVAPDGEKELEVSRPPPEGADIALTAMDGAPDDAGNTIQTPAAAKQKLTKAQRVIRARRLLKAGTKLLFAGKIERAKESLLECVDLDPSAAECHRNLGMLFRKSRSTYKAREHFTRYLELAPNAADAGQVRKMIEN